MSTRTEPARAARQQPSSPRPTLSFFEDPLPIRTILVTSDFSEQSFGAFQFAVPLARHFGAALHAVHVYEESLPTSSLALGPVVFSDQEVRCRLVEHARQRAGARLRLTNCHLRAGRPAQEILDTAREVEADLIVIATHGYGGFKHFRLGSTAEKIIRHAPCPVLVVRASAQAPIKTEKGRLALEKILVPVDFSECAREGARYASVFATQVGADLLLMHVIRPSDYMAAGRSVAGPDWPPAVLRAALEAEDKLDEIANFLPLTNISAETAVEVGEPAPKLAEASAQPDVGLVITSTHGYSGLRHALLGSIAEELVRTARCPVLIVPSHCRSAQP